MNLIEESTMVFHCNRCKKETIHRRITERSDPDDPFSYFACYDCGEINWEQFNVGYLTKQK